MLWVISWVDSWLVVHYTSMKSQIENFQLPSIQVYGWDSLVAGIQDCPPAPELLV